jgi:lambda repressor-like predicted transcriptional regulator
MGKAAKGKVKDVPITVQPSDWITAESKQTCVGDVDGKKTVLVVGGKLTINFDVILPGAAVGTGAQGESNVNYARDAVQPTLASFKKLVEGKLKEGLEKIVELHGGGDSKAYTASSSVVDKLNKYIKECLDDLRPNMRKAVAKKLGVSPKELLTVGTCRYKEMKIQKGVFADEVNFDEPPSVDIRAALKKKGWQYCGVVWKGKRALVGIDQKKQFNDTELMALKEVLGSKSATKVAGRVNANSQTKVEFEFLEKDKTNVPTAIGKVLRLALNLQTGTKMSSVTAKLVPEFTADKKGKGKEKGG